MHAAFTVLGRVLTPAEASAAFDPYSSCAGLALLVARSFARSLDGDVVLKHTPAGTCFELHARLFQPDAPLAVEEPQALASPPPTPRQPVQVPGEPAAPPAVPVVELTTRMFDHLVKFSDEVFTQGVNVGSSWKFVRGLAASALLRRLISLSAASRHRRTRVPLIRTFSAGSQRSSSGKRQPATLCCALLQLPLRR
jgi:hypothetical protein